MHLELSSAIRLNLDQSKILSSGNGLKDQFTSCYCPLVTLNGLELIRDKCDDFHGACITDVH